MFEEIKVVPLERIPHPDTLFHERNSRLAELCDDGGIDKIIEAKNEDEVFLQITMLLALGRHWHIYQALLHYTSTGTVTKEKLPLLMMMLLHSKWYEASDIMPQLKYADGSFCFSIEETLDLIEKAEKSSQRLLRGHEMHRLHQQFCVRGPFPVEVLRTWTKKLLDSWMERDKWPAVFAIALYNAGDTEVITLEVLSKYFENHCLYQPESHGNHRILSLIGFASHERGWDLMRYKKQIAQGLFYLFSFELKGLSEVMAERWCHLTTFSIIMEIIASFEEREVADAIVKEFEVMVSTWKRNLTTSLKVHLDVYAVHRDKTVVK